MCSVLLVCHSTIVELVFLKKKLSLLGAAPNRQNLKAVLFSSGRLLHPPSTVLPICLRTARARPTKILRAVTFHKTYYVTIHTNESRSFYCRLSVANIRVRTCFVLVWFLLKGKLPVQSLIPSLCANNLIPLTLVFLSPYLSPLIK